MEPRYKFLAIEGNIGAGKTTLSTKLSELMGTRLILEGFEDNPFLPGFYEDPTRNAFPLEMYFLAERFKQLSEELFNPDLFARGLVSDYYLEKSLIFARNTLNEPEYALFRRLYDIMFRQLPKPDLLVYLLVPMEQLQAQIKQRGRSYEQGIKVDYLAGIQQVYLDHLSTLKGMRILVLRYGDLNFASKSKDLLQIAEVINRDYPVGISRIDL